MNDLSINLSYVVALISILLSLCVLVYGMIKFKKKYLIILLLTLVIWPFVEAGMKHMTSMKVQKALSEHNTTLARSIQMTGLISRELIGALLVLSSAISVVLNEKKANQKLEPTVKTPVE